MSLVQSPRISVFDPARVAFGRHETFALRYGWLPKGFQALRQDPIVAKLLAEEGARLIALRAIRWAIRDDG